MVTLMAPAQTSVSAPLEYVEAAVEESNPVELPEVGERDESTKAVLDPVLVPVCSCESTGSPYNEPQQYTRDGSLVQGRITPSDWGMCQISTRYWLTESQELGYDLTTEDGNIQMANHIYHNHGIKHWNASRGCWGQVVKETFGIE